MGSVFAKIYSKQGDPMAAKQVVDRAIKENRVMVFSKTYCPYCTKAKRALGRHLDSSKVTVLEIEKSPDCGSIQDYLLRLTGGRSVPRVFIDGEFIGGGDETDALSRSGKLDLILRQKGIA